MALGLCVAAQLALPVSVPARADEAGGKAVGVLPATAEQICAMRGAAGAERLELFAIKATDPQGYPGEHGRLVIYHLADDRPACLTWHDGNRPEGDSLGLFLPGSGALAAFYGDGVKAIHIYRRDGARLEGLSADVAPDATARPVGMVESDRPNTYDIDGGGRFSLSMFRGEIANVTWHRDGGDVSGMAIENGPFMAAIEIDPEAFNGIALYVVAPDGRRASGRWTEKGAWGVGTDTLVVTRFPDRSDIFRAKPR